MHSQITLSTCKFHYFCAESSGCLYINNGYTFGVIGGREPITIATARPVTALMAKVMKQSRRQDWLEWKAGIYAASWKTFVGIRGVHPMDRAGIAMRPMANLTDESITTS